MSLEPPAVSEPGRDDLSAARFWLDRAADSLPPEVFDASNTEHLQIAAMLGRGYAEVAHFERLIGWRREDVARGEQLREADPARIAERDQRDEVLIANRMHREDEALAAIQEWRALHATAQVALPRDWQAVHILPGTPYLDEPSEMQPPGWFVFGGFSGDPEEGAAFVLEVDQALDRDDTGMTLERLAQTVAARLNGVTVRSEWTEVTA